MTTARLDYQIFGKKYQTHFSFQSNKTDISSDNQFELEISESTSEDEIRLTGSLAWKSIHRPSVGLKINTITLSLSHINQNTEFEIFQHGFQSWGYSTVYSHKEKDLSPLLKFLRTSQENPYTVHSGKVGDFISEGFVLLWDRASSSGYLLGVAGESEQNCKFRVLFSTEGKIEAVEVIYDFFYSPEFKSKEPIPLTEIRIHSFSGEPYRKLEEYSRNLARDLQLPKFENPVPTGWCSWYYYYTNISEKVILDNLREIRAKNLNFEFFQIDDGYQKEIGEWLEPNHKFPAGMQFLADEIKKTDLKPGIWLAPFLVREKSKFFQVYPEAILKDEEGKPVQAIFQPIWGWSDTYCMDLTHPVSKDYLENVFRTINKEWGYTYLKLDFLFAGILDGVTYDNNKLNPVKRYRQALEMIRKIVGRDTFLLGCGAPIYPSLGIFDGMRISCDVTPHWSVHFFRQMVWDKHALCTEKALINSLNRAFMHRNFWLNDPDCLIVRKDKNKMTYEQTILMATVMGLSGGMLLLSDDLPKMDEERYPIIQKALELSRTCQTYNSIPLGFMEYKFPRGFYNPSGTLGFWNPESKPEEFTIHFPYSLPFEDNLEFWSQQKFTNFSYNQETLKLTIRLEPFQTVTFMKQTT